MGEVAALHSERNDTKHTTEEDANPPKSNLESLPGDESSESINRNDLQDKGYMEYGCQHYRRRCRIRAPCCNEIFDCRHCHNDAKNDINADYKHRHDTKSNR